VELLGEDLGSAGAVATLGGGTVLLDRIAGRDHANDQPIEVLDQLLSNGVVHGLDGVLTPAGATLQATLIERGATTFLALAQALGLDDLLLDPASQATLLVPTDAAFEAALADPASAPLFLPENVALLEEVLLYHLISVQERRLVGDVVAEGVVLGHGGEAVLFTEDQTSARANAARIVSPNLPAAEGVVHLIDRVLGANDVVAELLAKDLASLAAAVVASDFAATLSDSAAPVTFFAPDDGAFAQLDAELLEQLSAGGPIGELPELLAYHTLAGEVTATELLLGDDPDTLTGEPLLIDRLGSTTLVNDARLVDADQLLTNGLVHTVDRVLTRPLDVFATLEARGLTTVRDALVQAGG
jgi:transforming growth factor-beta-induced protein